MDKAELFRLVSEYDDLVMHGSCDEKEVDKMTAEIEVMSPNSQFTDLYYYGGKPLNAQEIVDEMCERERIFESHGKEAVERRIIDQMKQALMAATEVNGYTHSAYQILKLKSPEELAEIEPILRERFPEESG